MSKHFLRELDRLENYIYTLGKKVQEAFQNSVLSLLEGDQERAQKVIEKDREIDTYEVEIEEEILKVIALYQPRAGDLRFLLSSVKINNDLERIGDLAVNICKQELHRSAGPEGVFREKLQEMGKIAKAMVMDSLTSFIKRDAKLAREVRERDDEVDRLFEELRKKVDDNIENHLERDRQQRPYLFISRYLERVADHATNIANDVIYLQEGEIVRHKDDLLSMSGDEPRGNT